MAARGARDLSRLHENVSEYVAARFTIGFGARMRI
jgi:hypothetical protein